MGVHGDLQTTVFPLRRTRPDTGHVEDDASPPSGELVLSGSTRYAEDGGRFASGARFPPLSREVSINLVTRARAAE